jgi:hypothetical protein
MTSQPADRRAVRFETVDELRAEITRLLAADAAGRLRHSGQWTAGQTFGHLAAWIEYAYTGFPTRVPWFVRLFIRLKLDRYLRDGLPAGVRIPGARGGTYGIEPLDTAEGARRLRAALDRLEREPARYDSPAFGKLTEPQRVALNLRHAELHLSYLHPE